MRRSRFFFSLLVCYLPLAQFWGWAQLLMGDDSSAIALHRIIPIAGRQPEAPAPVPTNDLEQTTHPTSRTTARTARTARAVVQNPMTTNSNVDVIRLWQLPDDFFALDLDAQWRAIKAVTSPAQRLNAPRRPCPLSLRDELLALSFFVATLVLPFALGAAAVWAAVAGGTTQRLGVVAVALILACHPLPEAGSLAARCSPLARALGRYFSLELFVDRDDPLAAAGFTPEVDKPERLQEFLPTVYLDEFVSLFRHD